MFHVSNNLICNLQEFGVTIAVERKEFRGDNSFGENNPSFSSSRIQTSTEHFIKANESIPFTLLTTYKQQKIHKLNNLWYTEIMGKMGHIAHVVSGPHVQNPFIFKTS